MVGDRRLRLADVDVEFVCDVGYPAVEVEDEVSAPGKRLRDVDVRSSG